MQVRSSTTQAHSIFTPYTASQRDTVHQLSLPDASSCNEKTLRLSGKRRLHSRESSSVAVVDAGQKNDTKHQTSTKYPSTSQSHDSLDVV
jgi:hypothetical protein